MKYFYWLMLYQVFVVGKEKLHLEGYKNKMLFLQHFKVQSLIF